MPVILPQEHDDSWLSGEAGKEILVPYPAGRMKAWPISARVNSPKNNGAEIIVPIEPESADPKILRAAPTVIPRSMCGKDKTRTWSIAEIDDLAHRFENSSIALRDLMKEIGNI
jgi:hypothetical protein